MNNFTTDFITKLLNNTPVEEIFRLELEKVVNTLLETELTSFLGYEKYSKEGYNTGDSRNGTYTRKFKTDYGELNLSIPRDRTGDFKQHTLSAYANNCNSLEETIILLYKKGVTTREISDLIEKMYGHYYSPQTVSNITKIVQEQVTQFHSRPITKRYVAIYCDATWLHIRRKSVANEALHIIMGITEDGNKEVLDYALYPEERAENYYDMLEELKKRGLSQVLLFVTDGLTGFSNALLKAFPKAKHQLCWIHLARNILKLVRAKDKAEVMDDFKKIYSQKTAEAAMDATMTFCEKYGTLYPKIKEKMSDWTSLFTYYEFPESIRRTIYTTNVIENLNKLIKCQYSKKNQFPDEDSMERFVCSIIIDYNCKNLDHIHIGFSKASAEILELFSK